MRLWERICEDSQDFGRGFVRTLGFRDFRRGFVRLWERICEDLQDFGEDL